MEIIKNEKLRTAIIQLYDYNYEILEKLEEQYFPAQFHENYFLTLSDHFKDYLRVDYLDVKVIKDYNQPLDAEVILIFKEVYSWRNMLISVYQQTLQVIDSLSIQIEGEFR